MNYMVPPNMSEKEKIVGGIFDLGQLFWLVLGGVLAIVVFLIFYPLLDKFAALPAIPVLFSGLPFVFYKPKGLTLYTYLKRKRRFKKKAKVMWYQRKEANIEGEDNQ